MLKTCKNCETLFEARNNQLYCYTTIDSNCEYCGKLFKQECSPKNRSTCKKSCSSKLIRANQGKKSLKKCENCENIFQAKNSFAKYCNKIVIRTCLGCENLFQRKCNGEKGSYCSTSCRNTYMRKEFYKISETECLNCGKLFTPTSSKQLFCGNDTKKCMFCGEEYNPKPSRLDKTSSKFCDNICSTLAQMDSKIDKTRLKDYKNIEEWFKRFQHEHGRKPMKTDFKEFFKVFPSRHHQELFGEKELPFFEQVVKNFITDNYTYIVKSWKKLSENRSIKYEIDLFIPDLMIGFEIQDFATHSKNSDNVLMTGQFLHWAREAGKSVYKKGPKYHEDKRLFAEKHYDIKIIEIWEDDILSGQYKNILKNCL